MEKMEKMENQKLPAEVRTAVLGGGAMWEPGDDICPPWWPRRRWPPKSNLRPGEAAPDLIAAFRVYDGLTLMAMSFRLVDSGLAHGVRSLGLENAKAAAGGLASGAVSVWDPDLDPCGTPPRRRWPGPGPGPGWWSLLDGPRPHPWLELAQIQLQGLAERAVESVPALGSHMLDTVDLLGAYTVAAKVNDARSRTMATQSIGAAVAESIGRLSHGASHYAAGAMLVETVDRPARAG